MKMSDQSRFYRIAAALLLLALVTPDGAAQVAPTPAAAQAASRDSHVIVISIDGLLPEYYTEPARLGLKVPNLVRMKLGGAHASGVESVYPSLTYPAHTTLVTGVRPARHGVIQNHVFEPPTEPQTGSWYWFADALKSETLWALAKKAGLVTAAVGWPVTARAEIDYNVPEIWDPAETTRTSKRQAEFSTPGLLARALATAPSRSIDERRTAITEFIINEHKPNLLLLHLVELDDAHHRHGARTPEAIAVAEREDGFVGRIIEATRKAGIFEKTTFLVVSDHGFAQVDKKYEPNVLLVKEKLITLDAGGKVTGWKAAAWPADGSCAIMLRDPKDKETADKVAAIFQAVAAQSNGPLNRVLMPEQLTRLGAVPGAALMLEAAPGYSFGGAMVGPAIHEGDKDKKATHGYLPTRAEMRASLIIYGAGARVGARIPLARMIDIAPTGAALLGLGFSVIEGALIKELVKPEVVQRAETAAKAASRKR
ncbi:MAG TPA: ectonucleotide pyrophosphatase/phosphodiesterase [Blastocatellia bacterium]|nr:ectonucleotide pyrophosphatase/phosphodiesterase [Blastocatellia bacterium]